MMTKKDLLVRIAVMAGDLQTYGGSKDDVNKLVGWANQLANTPDMMDDIKDFHKKFGLIMPPEQNPSLFNDPELYKFRLNFIAEELNEFGEAHNNNDLPKAFDALIDLTYVVLGTAYLMGLPFNEGWKVVHEANMKKVRAEHPSQSKRGTAYDVIKPEGWTPPDMQKVLEDYVKSMD